MALDLADVIRERRFLAANSKWEIRSADHGAVWSAELAEPGRVHLIVCLSHRALLDRLEEVAPPD
jgi:hypothetical protein